jgi:hypothetical protein
MKLRYLLMLCSLCHIGWVQAEIYKRIDADGHVTYSSTPLKGSKVLHLTPLPTIPPPPRERSQESPANFPRVDSATQKVRDNSSRKILENELATEEKALTEARANLQKGAESPELLTKNGKSEPNVAKQNEKMSALQKQVQTHERNIAALKSELSNRSK